MDDLATMRIMLSKYHMSNCRKDSLRKMRNSRHSPAAFIKIFACRTVRINRTAQC